MIWSMVAFLQKLSDLAPARYNAPVELHQGRNTATTTSIRTHTATR